MFHVSEICMAFFFWIKNVKEHNFHGNKEFGDILKLV